MLSSRVTVVRTRGFAGDAKRGLRRAMLEAGDAGFSKSFDAAPVGATSGLRLSGVEPTRIGNDIVWGYTSPYAADVHEGTGPHWVPIEDLRLWARRVLGDEGAAGGVQQKIAREGTDAQPFVQEGVEEMRRFLNSRGLAGFVQKERGGP